MSEKHWQMMKMVKFEIKRLLKKAEKELQDRAVQPEAAERGEL